MEELRIGYAMLETLWEDLQEIDKRRCPVPGGLFDVWATPNQVVAAEEYTDVHRTYLALRNDMQEELHYLLGFPVTIPLHW